MEEHPIERRRKELGLSRRRLAREAGVSDGYLALIVHGQRSGPGYTIAVKLARILKMRPEEVMGITESTPNGRGRPLSRVLEELGQLADGLESIEIPVVGSMPGLYTNATLDTVVPCRKYLSLASIGNRAALFALKVHGDWLRPEGICDGDLVIAERGRKLEQGKLYIAIRDGMTTAVKAEQSDDGLTLSALDRGPTSDLEVLGRIILSGHWRRH